MNRTATRRQSREQPVTRRSEPDGKGLSSANRLSTLALTLGSIQKPDRNLLKSGRIPEDEDIDALCHIVSSARVGNVGFQSVLGTAAANFGRSWPGHLSRRLEYMVRHGHQRGAGKACGGPPGTTKSWRAWHHRPCSTALPNPSLKGSTNGGLRGPGPRYGVHFRSPGPRIPPLAPP